MNLKTDGTFFPSTKNITKEVLETPYYVYDLKNRVRMPGSLINEVFTRSCEDYHPSLDPYDPNSASKVHFEILFFILEMLQTYYRSWQWGTAPRYINKFAPFVRSTFSYRQVEYFAASRHLIDTVIRCIRKYDDVFSSEENNWYRVFWKKNLHGWDFFNLNYDTTLEQTLGSYEDGYEDIEDQDGFQRFSINKLLNNKRRLSTINHMHGCILYGMPDYKNINHDVYDFDHQDMYKWPDVNTAYNKWSGSSSSSGTSQNGSVIVQGPIITGLDKVDKVTCLPYDCYRDNFFRCITNNRGLLIAGYSFGDPYINGTFYRMAQVHSDKTRVVLIDFWNIDTYYQEEIVGRKDVKLKDRELSAYLFEKYCNSEYCNEEMWMFIQRIVHHGLDAWKHFDKLSLKGPMVSDNGCLMLFIGGFRDAIEKYGDEILRFLKK